MRHPQQNTKDESGATYGLNLTVEEYLADMNETFSGEWLDKFLDAYPANDSTTAPGAYNSQWTDRSKVGTFFWSQLWAQGASSPVYNYFWDHAPPGQTQGAYHESESMFVHHIHMPKFPRSSQLRPQVNITC